MEEKLGRKTKMALAFLPLSGVFNPFLMWENQRKENSGQAAGY